MNISDYEKVQTLNDADAFLVDGSRGTKTILTTHLAKQIFSRVGSKELLDKATPSVLPEDTQLEPSDLVAVQTGDGMRKVKYETFLNGVDKLPKTSDEYFEMLDAFADRAMRNSVYRGKNIGNVINVNDHYNAKGLFVGDYLEHTLSNGGKIEWHFVDLNYGYSVATHINYSVIMPIYNCTRTQASPFLKEYSLESILTSGYSGSSVRKYLIEDKSTDFKNISEVYSVFPENIFPQVNHTIVTGYANNDNDVPLTGLVYDRFILPKVRQLLGFNTASNSNLISSVEGEERQFAISLLNPSFFHGKINGFNNGFLCQDILHGNHNYVGCLRSSFHSSSGLRPPSLEWGAYSTLTYVYPFSIIEI